MKLSTLARPPIQPHETERAETAICPAHDGLVRLTGDVEGRVLFCPVGHEFWRYTAKDPNRMTTPLRYAKEQVL